MKGGKLFPIATYAIKFSQYSIHDGERSLRPARKLKPREIPLPDAGVHLLEYHETRRSRHQPETRWKAPVSRCASPCIIPLAGSTSISPVNIVGQSLSLGFRPLPQTTPKNLLMRLERFAEPWAGIQDDLANTSRCGSNSSHSPIS